MSAVRTLVSTYRSRGPGDVVRLVRRRLAAFIYPGPLPSAAPPRRRQRARARPQQPPPPTPGPRLFQASDVAHPDALAFFERRRPTYEALARAVAPYVEHDGTVLDVGANIGYFTRVLGEVTRFRGTVHLYEPVPHLAELCAITLAGSPFQTVIHVHGLADQDATAVIYLAADGNLGWNTLVAEKAAGMSRLEIELKRFDVGSIDGPPCFVKIDVEGAEHRVLTGLLPALRGWGAARPVILCEVGWGQGHPDWTTELEVFDELLELGYTARTLGGEPLDIRALSRTTDVLFLPTNLAVS